MFFFYVGGFVDDASSESRAGSWNDLLREMDWRSWNVVLCKDD